MVAVPIGVSTPNWKERATGEAGSTGAGNGKPQAECSRQGQKAVSKNQKAAARGQDLYFL
jgi:hypothetical protein